MQKLVIVNELISMDVSPKFEGLIPVEFESKEALVKEIERIANVLKGKYAELAVNAPSQEDLENLYEIDNADHVSAVPEGFSDKIKDIELYFEKLHQLDNEHKNTAINGTFIDFTYILNDISLEITIPEVMTLEEWFESRLSVFKSNI